MIKAVTFLFGCSTAIAFKVTIHTEDVGKVHSFSHWNVTAYCTDLKPYSIIKTEDRSLQFAVKACHDAFLLLSISSDLNSTDFYEIVFGGTKNTIINIRRRKSNHHGDVKTVCANCLHCNEYRHFLVNWTSEGNFKIGTESKIYVDWTDPTPLPIKGFGIMSGWGSSGSWMFEIKDCVNRTYGYYCERKCGHCKSRDICDRINGSCERGCDEGWKGYKCDIADAKMCPCSCDYKEKLDYWSGQNLVEYTREELLEMLAPKLKEIERELRLDKGKLSAQRRRKMSAPDGRESSKRIGIVGIMFLTVVIGLVVLIDITAIRTGMNLRRIKQSLEMRY